MNSDLINITVDTIINHNLDINQVGILPLSRTGGFWMDIVLKLVKYPSSITKEKLYAECMKIKSLWCKPGLYRNTVINELSVKRPDFEIRTDEGNEENDVNMETETSVFTSLNENCRITITFPINIYEQLTNNSEFFTYSGTRKKFTVKFDNEVLNPRFQEKGLACWLKSVSNWFSSPKKNILWSGSYRCVNGDCKTTFKAKAKRTDQEVEFELIFTEPMSHTKIEKPKRITGVNRNLLGYELSAIGSRNVLNKFDVEEKDGIY